MMLRSKVRIAFLGVLALAAAVGITAGSAATTTKPYTANFDPGPVPGGSTVAIDLVLENRSSPQLLGSANVTVPSGFTVVDASFTAGGGDFGATQLPTTGTVQLRNLSIPPGDSATVEMQVETPCASDTYTWGIRAKQSNDFSGPPGNDFFLLEDESNRATLVSGAGAPGALAFTTQPSDGQAGAELPDVAVTVYDTCDNVATGASGDVTLELVEPGTAFGGSGATLGGDASQPVVSGTATATFDDLTVSPSGLGYKLRAKFSGVADELSDEFDIYDFYGDCTNGCPGVGNGTTAIDIDALAGTVGLGVGPAGTNSTSCGSGLTPLGSTFVIVPESGSTDTFTAVLTIAKRGLQGVGVSNIVVCVSGEADPDGVLDQRLSKCAKKNPQPKCILSQTSSNAGDAIITLLLGGDPVGSGFS
ncbi:MAG TPA: hypothetical protein VNJ53_00130 [Gaiellaceae bacterium]|nr:hypothetical protein [Gaiellaceae bacterium]